MFELRPFHRNNQDLTYNPFKAMEEFEKRFFEDPFTGFFQSGDIAEFKTDISDQGDSYLLEADLPGFEKKDIELDVSGDVLTISARRHSKHEEQDKKGSYVRLERSYGQYTRQFDISGIDADGIEAKYENGVLKLTMPKKQSVLPESRKLKIE